MPVDAEFLKDIERWRDELARNIALRNRELTVEDLNFAVQATIDRIIFLRVAEGQGAEEYGTLQALSNGNNVHARLVALYRRADQRYNSGLFDFARDPITPSLEIDDKVIKGIVGQLYERSPYDFSAIPVEILGSVYEQFLGRVIHLREGHQARVQDKPAVRKAGGVFYTPPFIVRHIIDRSLGPLCKGKTPKQLKSLRVLDPACGSGSFLLQAYQLLLDEHLDVVRDARSRQPQEGGLPRAREEVAPDDGREARHPPEQHLRRRHRHAGRRGLEALAPPEGPRRRDGADDPAVRAVRGKGAPEPGAKHPLRKLPHRARPHERALHR